MKAEDILKQSRARWKLVTEATSSQQEREREDLMFQVPEMQWTFEARKLREGDEHTPGRPLLSISKVDQPVRLVYNQALEARLGVKFHPVTEDADDDTAEVLQGIYRRIERDSNATDGRMWAFGRALWCGRGAYRVTTQYDEDADQTWDQEIAIERIQYQEAVYFDPSASKPDCSDGEYAFVSTWLPLDDFKHRYPNAKISKGLARQSQYEWKAAQNDTPEWVNAEPEKEAVLVAEYWYKEHETEVLEATIDGETVKRERDKVTVYTCKHVGSEMVEGPIKWPGKYIPLIPVLGREVYPYDGQRRIHGMIHNTKDGQRLYNHAASSLVERMDSEPKAPYIGAEGAFEGHEEKWKQINLKNYPYNEYKPVVGPNGELVPPPYRSEVNTQGMTVALAALQEADQFIQATTATFDPSLGKFPMKERSGRAIRALQDQMEFGTSDFIGDFARNSMMYEARVVMDLIPIVYDRPGRITQVLGEEGDSEPIMIGAPYVVQDGRAQPVPVDPMTGQPVDPRAKFVDFSRGRYTVSISVGRSYQTRVQEGRQEMALLLESQAELWPILGPTFLKYHDAPWAKEAAELLKKYRDQKFPGLSSDPEDEKTPEELAARLAAAEEFIEKLQGELKEKAYQLETGMPKLEVDMQKAQLQAMTNLKTTEMKTQADLQQTQIENQFKLLLKELDERFEAFERRQDRAHESRSKAVEQAHEATMKAAEIKFEEPKGPLTRDETIR